MKQEAKGGTTQQEKGRSLQSAVMQLLQWSQIQYNQIQYEQGLTYLGCYLNHDTYSVGVMERSRIFWNWWRNHWSCRDEQFLHLHEVAPIRNLELLRKLYGQYNDGAMLASTIHPNAVVLNESYAVMVADMIYDQQKV